DVENIARNRLNQIRGVHENGRVTQLAIHDFEHVARGLKDVLHMRVCGCPRTSRDQLCKSDNYIERCAQFVAQLEAEFSLCGRLMIRIYRDYGISILKVARENLYLFDLVHW